MKYYNIYQQIGHFLFNKTLLVNYLEKNILKKKILKK